MTSLVSIVTLGFFLGIRHATDADHVVAVTTIVARHRTVKHAMWIGGIWGLGHSLTIFVVGGAIILFDWAIPPRIGLSMDFSVALMLILLGLINLIGALQWLNSTPPRGSLREEGHSHPLLHNLEAHLQDPARRSVSWLDRNFRQIGFYQLARPLIVGIIHGLAGSAAVALLVLTTIRESRWILVYLLVFGVGTVAGMMLITVAVCLPFTRVASFTRLNHGFRVASGFISLAFGIFLAYKFGLAKGLFTSHPNWKPD